LPARAGKISVSVDEPQITINGDRATAKFRQHYKAIQPEQLDDQDAGLGPRRQQVADSGRKRSLIAVPAKWRPPSAGLAKLARQELGGASTSSQCPVLRPQLAAEPGFQCFGFGSGSNWPANLQGNRRQSPE
jgi:hypothetical protein